MKEETSFRLKNLLSRKFIAFLAATILLAFGKIEPYNWMWIAGAYIGLNVAQDIGQKIADQLKKRGET